MEIDGFAYMMMSEEVDSGSRKRAPTISESWTDISGLDWAEKSPAPHPDESSPFDSNGSAVRGRGTKAQPEPGSLSAEPEDVIAERLSKSLDLYSSQIGVEPPPPQFDSLDSTHSRHECNLDASSERSQTSPALLGRSISENETTGMTDSWVRPDYYPTSDEEVIDEPDTDHSEKLKVKLLTVWNNMKHEREDIKRQPNKSNMLTTFDRFKKDFTSKIWFTYRKDFPKLYGSQLTSDVGWGCMLRTGQMIIAQAFVMHYLGREWTLHHAQQNRKEVMLHHQIIRLFGDFPCNESPLSIQRLVRIGVDHGKRPGDWYGPASVAYVLRDAIDQAPEFHPLLSQMCIYVAPDCTVYLQDVIDLCTQIPSTTPETANPTVSQDVHNQDSSKPESAHFSKPESARSRPHSVADYWKAVIILIPVRLGGEALNPIYSQCVRAILAYELCLGIIGGKPKHSLYFVGWQEEKLLYLDPHFCQDTVDTRFRDFPTNTFHCLSPRKMSLNKMDPSCTLGFYIPTRSAFNTFVSRLKQLVVPPTDQGMYPLFVFQEGRSIDVEQSEAAQDSNRFLRIHHLDKKGRIKRPSQDSEDFVFL